MKMKERAIYTNVSKQYEQMYKQDSAFILLELMCHLSSGNECNQIVLLCSVMEWIIHTEQDKFHRKHISISQYNYSINFINSE